MRVLLTREPPDRTYEKLNELREAAVAIRCRHADLNAAEHALKEAEGTFLRLSAEMHALVLHREK